jgi:hypothetical protein
MVVKPVPEITEFAPLVPVELGLAAPAEPPAPTVMVYVVPKVKVAVDASNPPAPPPPPIPPPPPPPPATTR